MNGFRPKLVIFTDLDGTLLDQLYSYTPAMPALRLLRKRKIPLIFCSAKTKAEQELYQEKLKIHNPFIVENGGAIFIPKGYFSSDYKYKTQNGYSVIELGISYLKIRRILHKIKQEKKLDFKGFGDLDPGEIMAETGLDFEAALRAKKREYSETLILKGKSEEVEKVLTNIREAGLSCTYGGSFYSVEANDKREAVSILLALFRKKLGQVQTVGLGDSFNDIPMLSIVGIPMLVQKPGGVWEEIKLPNLRYVEGIGPFGWRKGIEEIIKGRN
jgi:mannosyl-3-phosphoglycerate phosphatase